MSRVRAAVGRLDVADAAAGVSAVIAGSVAVGHVVVGDGAAAAAYGLAALWAAAFVVIPRRERPAAAPDHACIHLAGGPLDGACLLLPDLPGAHTGRGPRALVIESERYELDAVEHITYRMTYTPA